jgi:hypothetical protein
MSRYHNLVTGFRRIDLELRHVVKNVDKYLAHLKNCRSGYRLRPSAVVVVAPDHGKRGERLERFQYVSTANVSGVNDEIAAAEKLDGLRAQEAVSVRDEPDARQET